MTAQGGLQALADEVLGEARERAEAIIREAEERAEAIRREARSAAQSALEEAVAEARREATRHRTRVESAAELEARRRLLGKREELIVRALARAHQRLLTELSPEERRAALRGAIWEAARALGGGELTVRADSQDRDLLSPAFLQEVTAQLEAAGIHVTLRVGDPVDISGGAIVSKDRGRVIHDGSFEARLEREQWELRNRVWQALTQAPQPVEEAAGASLRQTHLG